MNEDDLTQLIRDSSPAPRFPASFQREVWSRIAVAQNRSWTAWVQRVLADWALWAAKPAPAVATIMTMLIIGAGLGGMMSSKEEAQLKRAYAASINPILAAHDAPHQ